MVTAASPENVIDDEDLRCISRFNAIDDGDFQCRSSEHVKNSMFRAVSRLKNESLPIRCQGIRNGIFRPLCGQPTLKT
jgi:hypothetical protein